MNVRINLILVIFSLLLNLLFPIWAESYVIEKNDRTFIVDRHKEEWDVSDAVNLGFKPRLFRYGIGRDTFQTLDDSSLTNDHFFVNKTERVIGIEDSKGAKAFSVNKLRNHEIANSWQNGKPVAVGY